MQAIARDLLNGFVECLEIEEPEEMDPDSDTGTEFKN